MGVLAAKGNGIGTIPKRQGTFLRFGNGTGYFNYARRSFRKQRSRGVLAKTENLDEALAESLSERNDHDIIPTQNDRKNPGRILAKLARLRANLIPTQNERKNPEGILAKLAR